MTTSWNSSCYCWNSSWSYCSKTNYCLNSNCLSSKSCWQKTNLSSMKNSMMKQTNCSSSMTSYWTNCSA